MRRITLARLEFFGTAKRSILRLSLLILIVALALAQERPTFRVKVDMVVLSFQITDSKGKYINNLKPKDFRILEDGIQQKMATFGEGDKPPAQLNDDGSLKVPA